MKELSELPVFRSSAPPFDPQTWRLRVDGLVATPLALTQAEVLALPAVEDNSPFECVEGWRVPQNQWKGLPVSALLDRAGVLPEARFASFYSGDFAMSLTLDESRAPGVLLAHGLNGAALAPEHGGPLRLVVPGKDCFYGVKWVERVELAQSRRVGMETGKAIALGRIQRRREAPAR
ncbi:MAG: molybdopterin-dependent oxidoreductase [Chloroflexi bacterium]|nr:molybdopterin-dependent oxidoreductase [Chloroflexota bacterium]